MRQSYRLGLYISPGMNNEVPLSGAGRRSGVEMPRVVARNSDQQGDACLCRLNQSGTRAYADGIPAQRSASRAVKGEELAQGVDRASGTAQAISGPTLEQEAVGWRQVGIQATRYEKIIFRNQKPSEPDNDFILA